MKKIIFRAARLHIDKYISLKMKKEKHMSSICMKSKTKKKKQKKKQYMKTYFNVYIILSKESGVNKALENVSINYTFT